MLPTGVWASGTGATGTCGDALTWKLEDGILTISGEGPMTDYGDWEEPTPWWDLMGEITAVVVEPGVTTLGSSCFSDLWAVETVSLPETLVSIGKLAFGYCNSLTSVAIPASVTGIGSLAFYGCIGLREIRVHPDNANYASDDSGVLFTKDGTQLIQCPGGYEGSYTVPEGTTRICESAFENTVLYGVRLPDTLTEICEYAFNNCYNLKAMEVPGSVKVIGDYAISYCYDLEEVVLHEGIQELGEWALAGNSSLTGISVPASVTVIKEGAFVRCQMLRGIWVDAANPVYANDEQGVLYNKAMTTLVQCPGGYEGSYTVGDSVRTIGTVAFCGCDMIPEMTIPATVSVIDRYAFLSCENLRDIYYQGTMDQWKQMVPSLDLVGLDYIVVHCSDGDISNMPVVPDDEEYEMYALRYEGYRYGFFYDEGIDAYVSNNQGIADSNAGMTLVAKQPIVVTVG